MNCKCRIITASHAPHLTFLMRLFLFIAILMALAGCADQTDVAQQGDDRPPNFLIVFADDLGYGDLGSFGAEQISTPHLDQMANEGMRFTEFYSISPVCSPSRAGLLTGRYPIRMGINSVFFPESWTGIDAEEITLAEALQPRGYRTGIVGKWHLGHHFPFLPLQNGFDEYFGIPYSNDMEAVVYLRGNEVVDEQVDQHFTTQRYTEEALDFISRHQNDPFFLYVAHSMPHVPIYASPAFEGKSAGGLYGDVIEEIDWSTGQILNRLDELGLSENTLVVFTSDNGPWLVMEDHGGSAGPLREGKQFTFEGGMRVPTIAQWKGTVPANTTYDDLATMMDWFPTMLQFANVPLPTDRPIDGEDLSGVLRQDGTRNGQDLAYYMSGELRAFRSGPWKLKLPFAGTPGNVWMSMVAAHDILLFNLKDDPGEQNNLAALQPEQVAELNERIQAFVTSLGEVPPGKRYREPADNSHFDYLRQKHANQ